jgi:HSP20 family protein
VNSTEVKVVVRDGVLTLSGERPVTSAAEGVKTHLSERQTGAFQRRFTLPKDADGERVSAAFKNGLLTVSVPKREEVKPKEIEIQIA